MLTSDIRKVAVTSQKNPMTDVSIFTVLRIAHFTMTRSLNKSATAFSPQSSVDVDFKVAFTPSPEIYQ